MEKLKDKGLFILVTLQEQSKQTCALLVFRVMVRLNSSTAVLGVVVDILLTDDPTFMMAANV